MCATVAENQGDHLHALRGHSGWRAQTRAPGTNRQRDAGDHDHHERRLLQQVPECSATSHSQIGERIKQKQVGMETLSPGHGLVD